MASTLYQSWRMRRVARRQETAFRRTWQAFARYPKLADGRYDNAEWRAHNGRFACCLIRIPVEHVVPALTEFRDALDPLGLARIHPDHFLHIMIQELGFVCRNPKTEDEISVDRFDEVGSALSGALAETDAFDLTIRNINSFQDAAFLEVHDGGHCSLIHRRLREVAAIPLIPTYAYLPHITVAHYMGDFDSTPVVQALQPFRDTSFGTYRVTEVEIASLRIDADYPPIVNTRTLKLRDA